MSTTKKRNTSIWGIGLAMFAMFFGAGNIVFPLALGQMTQDKNFYAILGLMITAVFIPLTGLIAMMLYDGNYQNFFARIGRIPGYCVMVLILALIGPFGGIPRCITISYSTLSAFGFDQLPGMNLFLFSLGSVILIYFFAIKRNKIVSLIGYILTPILLLSLLLIVVKGAFLMPKPSSGMEGKWLPFSVGLLGGYNTMDLLAGFFFSSVILVSLKSSGEHDKCKENHQLLFAATLGSLIAGAMLALVYICFSYLAAGFSPNLNGTPGHEMLGTLSLQLLGPYAGLVSGVAVSFACLTTEIALTTVFAEFLRKSVLHGKISYRAALLLTVAIAFGISTLHFEGISSFLVPLLQICYPALIVLALLNLIHKLYDFKPVKFPVYLTFGVTVACYFLL
ncbi:MAG: branched-chain amino acid transport system II carrier protein [Chlamydiia bacterium]|nr:branched-chain amino acid transport system II carrier protein [Chlamydiia bacterium]